MKRSIALVTTAVLAAGLTGCSIGSDGTTDISKPGPSVTQAPAPQTNPDPPCPHKLACPR